MSAAAAGETQGQKPEEPPQNGSGGKVDKSTVIALAAALVGGTISGLGVYWLQRHDQSTAALAVVTERSVATKADVDRLGDQLKGMATSSDVGVVRDGLNGVRADVANLRTEMNGKFSEVKSDANRQSDDIKQLRTEMNGKFAEAKLEMNRQFDDIKRMLQPGSKSVR